MNERGTYIISADIKENGRTAYYKMLERVRQGELIQIRRGVYANAEQLSLDSMEHTSSYDLHATGLSYRRKKRQEDCCTFSSASRDTLLFGVAFEHRYYRGDYRRI